MPETHEVLEEAQLSRQPLLFVFLQQLPVQPGLIVAQPVVSQQTGHFQVERTPVRQDDPEVGPVGQVQLLDHRRTPADDFPNLENQNPKNPKNLEAQKPRNHRLVIMVRLLSCI